MTTTISSNVTTSDAQFNNPHTNVVTLWMNPEIWIYVVVTETTGTSGFKIFRSTDGGQTYTANTLATGTGFIGVSVWYDRWTPGNDIGDIIHILGASSIDNTLRYFSWNAANNLPGVLSNILIATHTSIAGSLGSGGTSICKSANGSLYASVKVTTTAGWYVYQSTNSGANWSNITTQGSSVNTAMDQIDDQLLLIPCSTTDDIMAIEFDNSTNFLQYQIYDDSANSWSAPAQIEDRFCGGDGSAEVTPCPFNATLDKTTSNIYLVFIDGSLHIFTEKFTVSTGKWTPLHPIFMIRQGETGSSSITHRPFGVSIQRDQTNGVLTVWYMIGGSQITDDGTLFYRHSSDDGMSWGDAIGGVSFSTDMRYIASPLIINNINEGWYCVFNSDNNDDLYGIEHDIGGAGSTVPGTFQYSRVYGNVKDSLGNNVIGAEVSVFREQYMERGAANTGGLWCYQGSVLTDSNGNYFVHVANYHSMYNYVALVNYDSCRKSVFPNSRTETSLGSGTIYASKFTGLTTGDKINQVTIYYTENPPVQFDARVKAYNDSSGSPNTLLGETGAITIPKKLYFERAVHVINFPTPITVPAGGIVWIAFETSASKTMFLKNGETSGTTKTVTHTFGAGPDPFGTPTNQTYGIWISITGDTKVDANIGDIING